MELFKLFGTIAIKNQEANKAIDETTDKGEKAQSKLDTAFSKVGGLAKTCGKAVAKGMTAGAAGVTALVTASVNAYADYEQLVGGVETLFKESSQKVITYADRAYQTAGLSANAYMETVTSFSASLLQSLEGDTEKAAEKADMAIIDMADNANKMGTDMSMIQSAYQGFAKQNYTMLDNLKLGYGGTQQEMYRLMCDAKELDKTFDADFSLSSKGTLEADFSDIVDAIHIVQTNMGITGTTAKEASSTISGSISSMKGSWQNLLTALSGEDWDIGVFVTNFVDSVGTVMNNLLPRIQIALGGVVQLVQQLAPTLIAEIPNILSTLLPAVINAATSLIDAIANILPQLAQVIVKSAPAFINGFVKIFNSIVSALPQLIQSIVSALPQLIPQLINGLVSMIVTLCKNIALILQPIIDALPDIIISIIEALMNNLPALIEGLITLMMALVEATPQIVQALVDAIPTVISMLVVGILGCLPQLIMGLIQLVGGLVLAQQQIWGSFLEGVVNVFKGLWDGIKKLFNQAPEWFKKIFTNAWKAIKKAFASFGEFFSNAWKGVKKTFSNVGKWFGNAFKSAWNGIKNAFSSVKSFFSGVWSGIKNAFGNVADWFGSVFHKAWTAVKNVFSTGGKIFTGIKDGILGTFKKVVNGIIGGLNKVIKVPFDGINKALNKIKGLKIAGWKPFKWLWTLPVPQIPELEQGGFLEKGEVGLLEGSGAEAVVPLEKNTKGIQKIADVLKRFMFDKVGGFEQPKLYSYTEPTEKHRNSKDTTLAQAEVQSLSQRLERIIELLVQFFPEALEAMKKEMVLDTGVLVAETAPSMNKALGLIAANESRGR